jgi:glycosyltransferase 2 family protein
MKTIIIKYTRLTAFVLLGVVTLYGVYRFMIGDWTDVITYWQGHLTIIPLLAAMSVIDVALEGVAWMWVYHRFQIRSFDKGASATFLAGRAGLLLPAQLGRLIRPDAMVKLKRATIGECLKAEAVVFILNTVSVAALFAGLLVYRSYPAATPFAVAAVIAVCVYLGNRIAGMLTHARMKLPAAFWWSWPTLGIIVVGMVAWIAHGVALYVVVADLPGNMTLWDSLFFGPGSAVLGVATGLPGGIGATEGLIGASLRLRSVPTEHLALAIAAFRLITFWIWIPIGWLALALVNRRLTRPITPDSVAHLSESEGIG